MNLGPSLRGGLIRDTLADILGVAFGTPAGAGRLCEMKRSGPEWLAGAAGVDKP